MLNLRKRHSTASVIKDDRALVLELAGQNLAEAAMFLGKSRQALSSQLGSAQGARTDYLRIGEILVLVMAARQTGREFDREAVRAYVMRTRGGGAGGERTRELVLSQLDAFGELRVDQARSVVLLLPSFIDLRSERPRIADRLRLLAQQVMAAEDKWLVVAAATKLQANAASQWLGLSGERAAAFGHPDVEHFMPLVLAFTEDVHGESLVPTPYMITDAGEFARTPQYHAEVLGEWLRSLVPTEFAAAVEPLRAYA